MNRCQHGMTIDLRCINCIALENENLREKVAELEKDKCRHGWRGSKPGGAESIADRCPACGNRSLFIGSRGWITCGNLGCKRVGLRDWLADAAMQAEGDAE